MCGIAGIIDLRGEGRVEREVLERMTESLVHRGPDSAGFFVEGSVGFGFRRLSIIDLAGGDQPMFTEDGSVVTICNGEIFNYVELREALRARGHAFRTDCDVEVVGHLYEEHGDDFLNRLSGQFALAVYDRRRRRLLLARDHFGVNPLYYTLAGGLLVFASEIKAILEHPAARREVDLAGLDQVVSFPGLVSPRTMFKDIRSLGGGHFLTAERGDVRVGEYWDLDYPELGEAGEEQAEEFYVERLGELFTRSVESRLQADVPVGFYLSGGLDSSMIAGVIGRAGVRRHSFSIGFTDRDISEDKYQRLVAAGAGSEHHEIIFGWAEIERRLSDMVYHCECPVKETYNTCSMALSEAARAAGVPVVLTGEGADELFAGYVGYRFDGFGLRGGEQPYGLEAALEEELRERLWGDKNLFYEHDLYALREVRDALYTEAARGALEDAERSAAPLVNRERLRNRHPIHQRSYLDFKLRLSDHLISDHGDRMALANSVEARYPFLDLDLIEFSRVIPPRLKLNGYTEKYVLRRAAEGLVPPEVLAREKYGFHAPGSPFLLRQNIEWINDLLSPERIRRQGYFDPDTVEHLKRQYTREGFRLNLPFESDLLTIVLTFGIFLERFRLPDLN
jgi:asparagine synthase (glutamine-hydrolysing)